MVISQIWTELLTEMGYGCDFVNGDIFLGDLKSILKKWIVFCKFCYFMDDFLQKPQLFILR